MPRLPWFRISASVNRALDQCVRILRLSNRKMCAHTTQDINVEHKHSPQETDHFKENNLTQPQNLVFHDLSTGVTVMCRLSAPETT